MKKLLIFLAGVIFGGLIVASIIYTTYWPMDGEIDTFPVKVFFGNSTFNQNIEDCRLVYPVEHRATKNVTTAHAAITELLYGNIKGEKREGYFTSINPGVKINSLSIENGIAKVDFDETLNRGVAGSCRVMAIRSQIEQTLKQFPEVKEVIISVNGRTEDILQP